MVSKAAIFALNPPKLGDFKRLS
jgi:hypothetical protein